MIDILLLQLAKSAVLLAVLAGLVLLLVRVGKLRSAAMLRMIWGGVLLVSLLGFTLPIRIACTPRQTSVPNEMHVIATPSVAMNETPIFTDVPIVEPQPILSSESPGKATSVTREPEIAEPSLQISFYERAATHAKTVLLIGWGLGFFGLIGHRLVSHFLLMVRLFRQVRPMDDATCRQWESLLKRHGFRKTAVAVRSTDATGPAIVRNGFGFVLLIPETLWGELSPDLREGVLRHELGHLLHRDTFFSPLAFLLASLQWFNPAAWFVLKRYNEATEWHADEFAYGTQKCGSSQLAETFLAIHQSTESQGLYLHSFSRFRTLDRINRLVTIEQSGKERTMKKYVIGTIALLLLSAGLFRIEFVAVAETPEVTNVVDTKREAAFWSDTTRRITGTVLDPDGKPVQGAIVGGCYQGPCSEIVKTDEEGKFEFLYPATEQVPLQIVWAFQPGVGLDFVPTREYPSFTYYGPTPPELVSDGPFVLKLRPFAPPFTIHVEDESGDPVIGATVFPWLIENPERPEKHEMMWNDHRHHFNTAEMDIFLTETDAQGNAVIDSVPADFLEYTTFYAHRNYDEKRLFGSDTQSWDELTENGKTPTMVLPRLAVVRGQVRLEDGAPDEKATIHFRFHDGSSSGRNMDENGRYEMFANAGTLFNISVDSKLGAAPAVFGFNIGDGSEEKQLDFVLKKGIRLYGKVTLPDGTPLEKGSFGFNEFDPNPPESFREGRPGNEFSRFDYSINTADHYGFPIKDGEYECLIPAETKKYHLNARGYPENLCGQQSKSLEINGGEGEIRMDFKVEKFGAGSFPSQLSSEGF